MSVITPNYGSAINFGIRTFDVENNDGYIWSQFEGTNPVDVSFDIILNNQTLLEAEEIAATIETISGEEYFDFSDDSGFFKDMKMSFDDFRIDFSSKNAYDARLKFSQRNEATELSLFSKFLKPDFIRMYATGQHYFDGDVIYNEARATIITGSGGSLGFDRGSSKKCFYYCVKDHLAEDILSENVNFVQNILPIDLEDDFSYQFSSREAQVNFKASFDQRVKQSSIKNTRSEPTSFTFDNLSNLKAKQLIHFCEHSAGSKRFSLNVPSGIFRQGNVFSVTQWGQRWNYEESNTVNISVNNDSKYQNYVEYGDVSGLIPPSLNLKPTLFLDSRYNLSVTGAASKITTFKGFSVNSGIVTSTSIMTSDTFKLVNQSYRRDSTPSSAMDQGGIKLGTPNPRKFSVAFLVKPLTKGLPSHIMGKFLGNTATLEVAASNISATSAGLVTITLPKTATSWISVVYSYDFDNNLSSIYLRTVEGNSAYIQSSSAESNSDFLIVPINISHLEFWGDIRYLGVYPSFLSQEQSAAVAQSLTNYL